MLRAMEDYRSCIAYLVPSMKQVSFRVRTPWSEMYSQTCGSLKLDRGQEGFVNVTYPRRCINARSAFCASSCVLPHLDTLVQRENQALYHAFCTSL